MKKALKNISEMLKGLKEKQRCPRMQIIDLNSIEIKLDLSNSTKTLNGLVELTHDTTGLAL